MYFVEFKLHCVSLFTPNIMCSIRLFPEDMKKYHYYIRVLYLSLISIFITY